MAVRAVQRDPNERAGSMSYISSAIIGGISGYTLKWVLPITNQEKDKEFYAELKDIAKEAFEKKKIEIEKIRTSKPRETFQDEFIKLYDAKKLNITEIRKLPNSVSDKVMGLFARINEKILGLKTVRKKHLIDSTKGIRPASVFISAGVCAGILIAVISNMIRYSYNYPEDIE